MDRPPQNLLLSSELLARRVVIGEQGALEVDALHAGVVVSEDGVGGTAAAGVLVEVGLPVRVVVEPVAHGVVGDVAALAVPAHGEAPRAPLPLVEVQLARARRGAAAARRSTKSTADDRRVPEGLLAPVAAIGRTDLQIWRVQRRGWLLGWRGVP